MKRLIVLCFTVVLGLLVIAASTSVPGDKMRGIKYPLSTVAKPDVDASAFVKRDPDFGKIPLYFISNKGQVDEKAKFYAKTSRYTLWMTEEGLVFDSIHTPPFGPPPQEGNIERDVSRLIFLEANRNPEIIPVGITQHKVNYYKGKDPSKWKKNIQTSKAVIYKSIYRNIDLKVYGVESQIEYDWIVKPGGNPEDIGFEYRNVTATHINNKGNLVIKTTFGEFVHKKPLSYQLINGEKVDITSEFKAAGADTYAFNVEDYNANYELIIDPVVSLAYSTYLGGSSNELYTRMFVDESGQVHLTGYTYSNDFPIQNAYQASQASPLLDAILTKFDSTGSGLIFSTYFGGSSSEYFFAITVSSNGDIYIAGDTFSSDLPAINSRIGGKDVFIARFDSSGNYLAGRYLGGSSEDRNSGIVLDSSNHLLVHGWTRSTDFPTINPYQGTLSGTACVFVSKLASDLSGIDYSTYLGGTGEDNGSSIGIDNSGYFYVIGRTSSSDFPLKNAWQNNHGGGQYDVFLTKFEPDGSGLAFSTYLGGSGGDYCLSLAVDGPGSVLIGGFTDSNDFPTKNPYQATNGGGEDVFISLFNADGSDLLYSTYLGGAENERGGACVSDSSGNIYVSGATYSSNFPTKDPYQSENLGSSDAFLSILSQGKAGLVYSTLLGGSGWEYCLNIDRDGSGNIYIAGNTGSSNFPVLNSYQYYNGGGEDAFVARFSTAWTLNVQSTTDNGVHVAVSPQDNNGNGNGNTNFTRIYMQGEIVTLTAPETFNGKDFYKWAIDGGDRFKRTIKVTMNRNHTASVEYRAPAVVHTLNVQSTPDTGALVAVAPVDNDGNGNGKTNFTRTYNQGEIVTLTAPESFKGKDFYRWSIDGVDNSDRTIQVTMDNDHTVMAVYESPPGISLSRTQLNFGVRHGGETTGTQTVFIENTGGLPLEWTVNDNATWLDCGPASGTNFGEVGVSVNGSGLSPGTYTGTVTVSAANAPNSPQTVTVTLSVYAANATAKPFGYFETPRNGSTVMSSIPVTGWVLDDIEVMSVKIYREENGGLVYIGDAIFVDGARPDVELAYPDYPKNYRAGWGYMMLTNFLPGGGNGTFTFYAIAMDKEGNQVTLGTKTVICDNAHADEPFGAIDTPGQGGTASGADYRNLGWVLTPPPNKIPEDGHTIIVWIDGIDVGKCKYNIYRKDVAALFPGYANSDGSLAYFDFDTAVYENGMHTIQWTAMDNAGNADGIGNRYFYIRNTGAGKGKSGAMSLSGGKQTGGITGYRSAKELSRVPFNTFAPVRIRKGYKPEVKPVMQYPDDNGNVMLEIKELERIEIHLQEKDEIAGRERPAWIGFHVIGDRLSTLPVGSVLDTGRGIFYWQPGPGFVGKYRLAFVQTDGYGNKTKKNLWVNIVPKFKKIENRRTE